MASLDLSIHCYSLFQVLNLEVNGKWHLGAKMGLMFTCILAMQALNYVRYILVGLRLPYYTQYDENFLTSQELKQDRLG